MLVVCLFNSIELTPREFQRSVSKVRYLYLGRHTFIESDPS